MSTNATRRSDGERVKLGITTDLDQLRPDQIGQVTGEETADFSASALEHFTFRFPFPGEDGIQPGDFNGRLSEGLRVDGWHIGADLKHHDIQFAARAGILVMLPCPYSAEAETLGQPDGDRRALKYMFNGYRGALRLTRQAWHAGEGEHGGVWATLVDCVCGARYVLTDLDDARPLLDALEEMAKREEHPHLGKRPEAARNLREVAHRIEIGYSSPIPPAELRAGAPA